MLILSSRNVALQDLYKWAAYEMIWISGYAFKDSHSSKHEIGSISFWFVAIKSSTLAAINSFNLSSESSKEYNLQGVEY